MLCCVQTRPGSSGWVIFDECVFSRNQAPDGWGGAAWSGSGHVIFAACTFVDNAAMGGGALHMVDGGLVGGCRFAGNRATSRAVRLYFHSRNSNGNWIDVVYVYRAAPRSSTATVTV